MRKTLMVLVLGTAAAQAITLCVVPVLTRLFSPAEFGLFGLFSACVSVLGNAAALRYELAIVLPERRQDAASVFALCLPIVAALSALTLLVVVFGRDFLAKLLGQPDLAPLLWWLPLSVLVFGSFQSLNFWATSASRFAEVSVVQIGRAAAAAAIQVICGVFGFSASGLVAGQSGGQALATLGWLWWTWARDGKLLRPAFDRSRMAAVAHRYRSFPVQSAPQALVNSFSQTLPLFLMGMLFSPQVAGLYVLAQRLLEAPAQLVSSSFRQVLLPRYARALGASDPIGPEMSRTTWFLFLLALPAVPVLALWGGPMFAWAFGAEWRAAGEFAAWLVVAAGVELATPPATSVLTAMEQQRLQLLFEVVMLIGRAAAILVGGLLSSPMLAIGAFSLVSAALNAALIVVARNVARRRDVCLAGA